MIKSRTNSGRESGSSGRQANHRTSPFDDGADGTPRAQSAEGLTSADQREPESTSWLRWTMASIGVACVGLGALGAFLPGMPTTIFLIGACFLFARSNPNWEKVLVRNRFFARYLPFVDGRAGLSKFAKIGLIVLIWTSTVISCSVLYATGVLGVWPIALIVGLNAVGSVMIWRS